MCARRIWRNHITARANTVRPYSLYTLMFWPRRGQCGKRKKSVKKNAALLHFLAFPLADLVSGVPRGRAPLGGVRCLATAGLFSLPFLVTKKVGLTEGCCYIEVSAARWRNTESRTLLKAPLPQAKSPPLNLALCPKKGYNNIIAHLYPFGRKMCTKGGLPR